jgi:hypothetical protein
VKEPHFVERDRDRIRLFPAGATRAPDANLLWLAAGRALGHECGDDVFAQETELRGVSKEAGLGDRYEIQQIPQLGLDEMWRGAAQTVQVFLFARQRELLHARRH